MRHNRNHFTNGERQDSAAALKGGRRPVLRLSREQYLLLGGLTVLFGLLLYLCWQFPVIGDDWFREELGRKLTGPWDLVRTVMDGWGSYNSRIMGNILAYSAGGRKLLRELMRAGFTLGTAYLAARHMGFRSLWGVLLCVAALLALPLEMFRQIYPWAAGFFNYVPPVLTLLWALWLVRPAFAGERVKESIPRGAAVFLLGFSGQLFMENNTLYALWAAMVLMAGQFWRQRRPSPVLMSFFAGTAAGAVLLFASPAYGLVLQGEGGYESGAVDGLSGLLGTLRDNQEEVLRCLIAGCPVLYVALTVLGLVWMARSRRSWPDWLAAGILVLGSLYFAFGRGQVSWVWATPIGVVAWGLALLAGFWRWLPPGGVRNRALFFTVSAAVAAFPLLFVKPIGPRCLYLSYVCLLIAAGNCLTALPWKRRVPALALRGGACLLAAAVLCHYMGIFRPIRRMERERDAALVQAMEKGERQVELPAYPHGEYMWDGDSVKVENRYYYETPGDLAVRYLPAEEWEAGRG